MNEQVASPLLRVERRLPYPKFPKKISEISLCHPVPDARLVSGWFGDSRLSTAMTNVCRQSGQLLLRDSDYESNRATTETDVQNFDVFFEKHRPGLITYLRRRTVTEADAEEIAQESYTRLLGYRHGRSRPPQVWRSLLYRIAGNLAISQFRTHRRHHLEKQTSLDDVEVASETPSQERIVLAQQELAIIRRTLEALTPKCRRVFLLSRAHQKTYPEIAQTCGISVKMVEKHMSQALAALRRAIGGRNE